MRSLVFDLDDTLLNSRKRISSANRLALLEAIEAGFQLVIATSRPMRAISRFVDETLLQQSIVISLNGSVVHRGNAPETARVFGVIGERTATLLAAVDDVDPPVAYSVETDGQHFATNRLMDESELRRWHSATPDMVIPLDALNQNVVTKVAVDGDNSAIGKIVELAATFPELRFIPAAANTLVNIVPIGVDKSLTLEEVARTELLDLEASFAFGDDIPDLEMFRVVGAGVAMDNAIAEVKRAATHHIDNCDTDAIAAFIRQVVL